MRTRFSNIFGNWSKNSLTADSLVVYKPMKLIVWLGNPWSEYANTRHNVGFLMLDEIVHQYDGTDFLYSKKFDAELATGIIGKRQVLYIKPQTFMNKSWVSVRSIANFYKISLEDILVIHDDIDHEFGKIKLKFRGAHGGHNGVRDIIEKMGGKKFRRLKLWIGRPAQKSQVGNFVLGKMKKDELSFWSSSLWEIFDQVELRLKNTW